MFIRFFEKWLQTDRPKAMGQRVKYTFHFPGFNNFHLLPSGQPKQPLYVFMPQQKQPNFQGHAHKQLNNFR